MGEAFHIETDVDILISLVKDHGKISIDELSRKLKVKLPIVQKWVDFLIDEGILGVEYKFITPYVYLIQNKSVEQKSFGDDFQIESKDEFFNKAKSRGLKDDQIRKLWESYLESNIEDIKKNFISKSRSKNLSDDKILVLWDKYNHYLRE